MSRASSVASSVGKGVKVGGSKLRVVAVGTTVSVPTGCITSSGITVGVAVAVRGKILVGLALCVAGGADVCVDDGAGLSVTEGAAVSVADTVAVRTAVSVGGIVAVALGAALWVTVG